MTHDFEVVVWGATGYTGRLVSEVLAQNYQGKVTWAIAGRNDKKLKDLKTELAKLQKGCEELPILVASVDDPASLDALTSRTTVLISTAGPFTATGGPVVEACLRTGTHYCDLAGEVPWVRRMVVKHHEAATAAGVKLVHCCGFDSLPFDLAVLVAVEECRKLYGSAPAAIATVVTENKGGASGGSLVSAATMFTNEPCKEVAAWRGSQFYLVPGSKANEKKLGAADTWRVQYSQLVKGYTVPHVMQIINSRVIRRTAALLGWGDEFSYREVLSLKTGCMGAKFATGAIKAGMWSLRQKWLHPLLAAFSPKPGKGPSKAQLQKGRWHVLTAALPAEQPAGEGKTKKMVVVEAGDDTRDPGYLGSSRMIVELALCLAQQGEELKAAGLPVGGSLTPAAAGGKLLVERLKDEGIKFEVKEEDAVAGLP